MAAVFGLITEPYVCVWDSFGCRNVNGSIINTQKKHCSQISVLIHAGCHTLKETNYMGRTNMGSYCQQGTRRQHVILDPVPNEWKWMALYQRSERRGGSWLLEDSVWFIADNYLIIEAFQSLAPEWRLFQGILHWSLNSTSCFSFSKQTGLPSQSRNCAQQHQG